MYTGSCTEQTKASSLYKETKEDQDEETNCDAHTEGPENNHQAIWWSDCQGLMELLIALIVIRCAASEGQVGG